MAKKSNDKSGLNLAPFLLKCYEMVSDESTDNIISWSQSNDSFVIWDSTQFSSVLLPKFFKHNNFSSFMRQLNIYGFRKIGDRWEFANEGFIKDQKHLMNNIKRRKPSQAPTQKTHQHDPVETQVSSDDVDYTTLQKEVEILKTDKSALMQELIKLRERHESSQNLLVLLRERLQGMENNQQQLLSFLVMVMQSPGLLVQLLQSKENTWRMAEARKIVLNEDDSVIVRYQPLPGGTPSPTMEEEEDKTVKPDISFDMVKDFFMNFNFPSSSPLDESFLSSENGGSIVPSDEFDLDQLEKFLLSSPAQNDMNSDEEEALVSEMELESALHGVQDSDGLDVLTETLECLCRGNEVI